MPPVHAPSFRDRGRQEIAAPYASHRITLRRRAYADALSECPPDIARAFHSPRTAPSSRQAPDGAREAACGAMFRFQSLASDAFVARARRTGTARPLSSDLRDFPAFAGYPFGESGITALLSRIPSPSRSFCLRVSGRLLLRRLRAGLSREGSIDSRHARASLRARTLQRIIKRRGGESTKSGA